jgi:hypothetical protein
LQSKSVRVEKRRITIQYRPSIGMLTSISRIMNMREKVQLFHPGCCRFLPRYPSPHSSGDTNKSCFYCGGGSAGGRVIQELRRCAGLGWASQVRETLLEVKKIKFYNEKHPKKLEKLTYNE